MPLGKLLERGQRITAIVPTLALPPSNAVARVRVKSVVRGRTSYRVVDHDRREGMPLRRRDEGITWIRGWDGLDVDAFRAQAMLENSAR